MLETITIEDLDKITGGRQQGQKQKRAVARPGDESGTSPIDRGPLGRPPFPPVPPFRPFPR